jgi:hypothetical protein
MIPEVATYIQSFKNFLKKNEEAKAYFLKDVNEDLFFKQFKEIAEKNFEQHGEPMLNKDQLESLRKTMTATNVIKNDYIDPAAIPNGIFINIPNYGFICLN